MTYFKFPQLNSNCSTIWHHQVFSGLQICKYTVVLQQSIEQAPTNCWRIPIHTSLLLYGKVWYNRKGPQSISLMEHVFLGLHTSTGKNETFTKALLSSVWLSVKTVQHTDFSLCFTKFKEFRLLVQKGVELEGKRIKKKAFHICYNYDYLQ